MTIEDYLFVCWSINSSTKMLICSTKVRALNEQLVDQFVDWSTNRRTNNPLVLLYSAAYKPFKYQYRNPGFVIIIFYESPKSISMQTLMFRLSAMCTVSKKIEHKSWISKPSFKKSVTSFPFWRGVKIGICYTFQKHF